MILFTLVLKNKLCKSRNEVWNVLSFCILMKLYLKKIFRYFYDLGIYKYNKHLELTVNSLLRLLHFFLMKEIKLQI